MTRFCSARMSWACPCNPIPCLFNRFSHLNTFSYLPPRSAITLFFYRSHNYLVSSASYVLFNGPWQYNLVCMAQWFQTDLMTNGILKRLAAAAVFLGLVHCSCRIAAQRWSGRVKDDKNTTTGPKIKSHDAKKDGAKTANPHPRRLGHAEHEGDRRNRKRNINGGTATNFWLAWRFEGKEWPSDASSRPRSATGQDVTDPVITDTSPRGPDTSSSIRRQIPFTSCLDTMSRMPLRCRGGYLVNRGLVSPR